jgi:hypothetical protein
VRSKPVVSSPKVCPRPSSLKLKPIVDAVPYSKQSESESSGTWGLGWLSSMSTLVTGGSQQKESTGSAV